MDEEEKRNDFGNDGEEVLNDSVLQNGVLLDDVGNRLGFCVLHVRVLTMVNLLYVNGKNERDFKKKETLTSRQDLFIRVLNHMLFIRERTSNAQTQPDA